MQSNKLGEIITFYSYKGGTGRSMALSNIACILAKRQLKGKGVLMIDWDLEAPGLHRFFHDKFKQKYDSSNESVNEFNNHPGLIDLFIELKIPKKEFICNEEAEKSANDILRNIDLEKFVIETDIPNLSLLKAGRFDKDYSKNVNTFNWEDLYNQSPYLLVLFAEKLTQEYDYVLIDSRTGYTDISGICTSLMPHKLVVVFTPNRQNYEGIEEIVRAATGYRRRSEDLRPLLVYPLPTRIESSRDDLRVEWRFGNSTKFIKGYQRIFESLFNEVYDISNCNLHEYFEDVQIQHSPDYAYGEEIAVTDEMVVDRFSLSHSYRVFAGWLIESYAPWQRSIDNNIPEFPEYKKLTAVIFTTLPVEYNAVRNHLQSIEEIVHPRGTIYEQGFFSYNGKSLKVWIAEIGEGNEQAALEAERAIQYFNPSVILFVGIAGGVKNVQLGDVVVASKVYGEESGKAGDIFKQKLQLILPSYKMINRARAEARKDDWLQRLGELVPNLKPNVFIKPIADCGKIQSSTRSEFYNLIKSNYEDILAVEMEGYGFLKAAEADSQVEALIIRGISDLIYGKNKDKANFQEIASRHASAFAFEILAKLYLELVQNTETYKPYTENDLSTTLISPSISALDGYGASNKGSVFGRQQTIFRCEKEALAKKVIEFLEIEMKVNKEIKYCLLIDSGTTTYYLFCEICDRVIKYIMENNRDGIEIWTKRVLIITNNLPGIQYLMKYCKDGSDEYADLLIKCLLIPGKPLSVYAAVTGREALDFLTDDHIRPIIRDKLGAKDDEYKIISFLAANYMVRHPSKKPSISDSYCPVTRLEGHFEMKTAFAKLSDEIYIISPLTKFSFATCKQLNELNGHYIDEQTHPKEARKYPSNVMYREIELTDDTSRKKCTFFITKREKEDLLWKFANDLKEELENSYGHNKVHIAADFKLEQCIPVNRRNNNYRDFEIEREVPRLSLRNAYNKAKKRGGQFIWDKSWIARPEII